MKLLRVIATIDPRSGGPIEGLKRASAVMDRRGVAVEVASLDAPGALPDEERHFPWPFHPLGPTRLGNYGYCPALRRWLDRHARDYHAVIVHGNWQYHGLAVSLACAERGVPYCVYPHGMLDPWFNRTYPLKKLKKQLYWRWGEHRVLSHAAAVLFTCEEERRLARQSFRPYRVTEKVVGYGTTAPEAEAEAGPAAPHPAGGRPYLLFLGRVQEKKGLDLLLGAYAALRAGNPGAPGLVVAGPPQPPAYADALRARFPMEGVHWAGPVAGAEKWRLLRGAEALALTSHQENFGLVVAEALAVGTPVLISDKVNIWREIDAGGAGLVEPDTPAGAERLLRRWSALDATDRGHMATRARSVFREHFEIESATDRLIGFLRSIPAAPADRA